MEAVHAADLPAANRCGYPEPFREECLPREKRALGDAFGLTRIGVNLTTLMPGKVSAMRHWHTHEDELIYVLEGEVVLVTDQGEQMLTADMTAGFPAGVTDGHQLRNRSDAPARYLEISNRDARDDADYPDIDLILRRNAAGERYYAHRDGTPY